MSEKLQHTFQTVQLSAFLMLLPSENTYYMIRISVRISVNHKMLRTSRSKSSVFDYLYCKFVLKNKQMLFLPKISCSLLKFRS